MIKAFGIFKVVLSIAMLTFAPFVFIIGFAPPALINAKTNNWLFIFFLLVPYACYLFYSGQTQLMKLKVKKPGVIRAGGIFGIVVAVALITNFLTAASFLAFSLILTISVQDIFRLRKPRLEP